MGKGDIKTKRGKIAKGTFGVSRPRTSAKVETKEEAPKKKKAKAKK